MERKEWNFSLRKGNKAKNLKEPLGFNDSTAGISIVPKEDRKTNELKDRKAWEIAKSPMMSMFMTLFFLYTIGDNIQVFSIVITISMIFPQMIAIFKMSELFAPLEDKRNSGKLLLPKLVYCGFHIVILSAALYKFIKLGLIPVRPIDWLSFITYKHPDNFSIQIQGLLLQ